VIDRGVVNYYGVAVHGERCCISCKLHYNLYKTGWPSRDLTNLREITALNLIKKQIFQNFGSNIVGELLVDLNKISLIKFFPTAQYKDQTQTFPWTEGLFIPGDSCMNNPLLKRLYSTKQVDEILVITLDLGAQYVLFLFLINSLLVPVNRVRIISPTNHDQSSDMAKDFMNTSIIPDILSLNYPLVFNTESFF
jgi:hypothetical protein